jgi:predicted O-linked N-acetylglucosamine transferase (SPINDLY family)
MTTISEALQLAFQHHQANRFTQAERIYRQIIDLNPRQVEEIYGLAVLAQLLGQHHNAEQFFQKVLQLQPEAAEIHNRLGFTLQQQGKIEEAIACFQKALKIQPDYIEAQANLGNAFHLQGKLTSAEQIRYADLSQQSALDRQKMGDLKTAEFYYRQAITLQPDLFQAHKNLGDLLQKQGRLDDAFKSYQQAIKIQPNYAYGYHNLGYIFQKKGKFREAIVAYKKALDINPNLALTYNSLGNVMKHLNQFDAAIEYYQQAIKTEPNPNIDAIYYNLGNALRKKAKLEEAAKAFEKAIRITPNYAPAKFGICIGQLPIIYSSVDEIKLKRNQYQQQLQNLAQSYQLISQEERKKSAEAVGTLQPFYLAYQGLNDRDLQRTYGEMICQIMSSCYPQYSQPIVIPNLDRNQKVRIGIVSGYFCQHSVWKIPIKGWVENLDRSEFELFGYYTDSKHDSETVIAAKTFDKFTQGPLALEKWAEVIAQDKLAILIFPEFGMDPMTVKLGCLRLAPVQMVFGGHPETSGMPTIDYHLSSDLMEPDNAQEHYTEKLVRLPNLAISYTLLNIQPQAISKKEIGIEDDQIMFWSCQSLFKYLPQHDDVFPRIAKELGNAKFVFIQDSSKDVTEIFRQRLNRAFAEFQLNYQDYCIFLPRLNASKFAGATAIADVFLDNIGWSGNNTTMESTAYNLPIVTLPGDLMRGRHSFAILKMMGIEETIASNKEEYVQIAVRLGKDAQYRQRISQLIASNKHKLYGDVKPVRALEDFLLQVVNKPRRVADNGVTEILRLAMQHHRANQLVKAQQAYHQVLAQQPDHPDALYGLGIVSQQLGQLQEAEDCLSASARVQPNSVKVWFSLGNLYQAQGQLLQAESAYKKAIALRPDAGTIYNNLAYTLQQQGKWEEAIVSYQKALEFQPNCLEADVNLGNALFAQGKLSKDKQVYYGELNYKLGNARKQAADWKTAAVYYQQAIALKPDIVEAHYNLGFVFQQQGQMEEAIACYQKVLELNPQHQQTQIDLEQIYQTQHKEIRQFNSSYSCG